MAATDPHASASPDFFVAGGTMRPDAPSYVERRSDGELYEALSAGEFAYVLTSRQMGKSSLMVRTAARLREDGVTVGALDLTGLGQNLNAEQWYTGLMSSLGERLDLEDELEDFWDDNEQFGPLHRWMRALRQVVLGAAPGNVVVFIDEIDVVQSLPFSTAELFAAIRECYTRRAEDPDLDRLTFCLVGVATPAELIDDPLTTPFNIGKRIELRDFDGADALVLVRGMSGGADVAPVIVGAVCYWTGGHPYLTQRLCQVVLEAGCTDPDDVEGIIAGEFFSDRAREQEPNLQFVHGSMVGRHVDTAALLTLYRRVLRGKPVRYDETNPLINVLRLSGIIRVDGQRVHVRNPIYARVFGRAWIDENMPGAELRRQKAAQRRGILQAAGASVVVVALVGALGVYAHVQRRNVEGLLADTTRLLTDLQIERANDGVSADAPTRLFDLVDAWSVAEETAGHATSLASLWAVQHARVSRGLAYVRASDTAGFDMKVSTDGSLAAAGYADGSVRLWRCATGEPLGILQHDAAVHELIFTGDDRYLVAGLTDGSVHVWVLATRRRAGPALSHGVAISDMGVASDGALLTGERGAGQFAVRRWDVASGELISTAVISGGHPFDLQNTPDGRYVAVHFSTAVGLYDLTTDEAVWTMPLTGETAVRDWTLMADRLVLVVGGDILSVGTDGKATLLPPCPADARRYRLSQDGAVLALAYAAPAPRVEMWDVATGRPIGSPWPYDGSVGWYGFEFFARDERVFLETHADATSTLFAWNWATGRQLAALTIPRVQAERTFPTMDVALRGSYGGSTIRALRYAPSEHVTTIGNPSRGVGRLAVSPDGTRLALASDTRDTLLVGAARASDLSDFVAIPVGAGAQSVDWRPDGEALAVALGSTVVVVTPSGDTEARRLHVGGECAIAVYCPSGDLLAACDQSHSRVRFWETGSLEVAGQDMILPAAVVPDATNLAFAPDGSLLATAHTDGVVRLWDMLTRRQTGPVLEHGGAVNSVVFSEDGTWLASTNWAGETAKVWHVATREQVGETLRHKGVVWGAAFHPGGELLVVGSNDQQATLWHWETGTNLTPYVQHPVGVGAAAFSPDGRALFTIAVSERDAASGVLRRWTFPRVPTSLREAELRTSLFTGVTRERADRRRPLTSELWRAYSAELRALEEIGTSSRR